MVTDKERAECFLAIDRYGEDTPETRDRLKLARADRVQALEAEFAAVRAERGGELVVAAQEAKQALLVARRQIGGRPNSQRIISNAVDRLGAALAGMARK